MDSQETSESQSVIPRAIDGTFLPGYRPPAAGVGRTKGSLGGRAKALLLLDKIVGEECVQAAIAKAMRDAVMADPMKFFRQVIMPLLPQDVKVKLGEEGARSWIRISTMYPTPDSLPSMPRDPLDSARCVVGDAGERPYASPPNCSTGQEERLRETTDGSPRPTSSPSEEWKPSDPLPETSSPSRGETPFEPNSPERTGPAESYS